MLTDYHTQVAQAEDHRAALLREVEQNREADRQEANDGTPTTAAALTRLGDMLIAGGKALKARADAQQTQTRIASA